MIYGNHYTDENGNPAGGTTYGIGFAIGWQHGPLGSIDRQAVRNGASVEGVILAAIDRLEFFQRGKFPCHYNETAIRNLQAALLALDSRTSDRIGRAVEGTNQA